MAQWVHDPSGLCGGAGLWRTSQLQLGFDPWPQNFNMLQEQARKKKERKKTCTTNDAIRKAEK